MTFARYFWIILLFSAAVWPGRCQNSAKQPPTPAQQEAPPTQDSAADTARPIDQLEPTVVNVTASRTAVEAKELPQAVDVVGLESLEQLQPSTPNELLREVPGIFSPQVGQQGSPIIRGVMGNRVLYLWNGLRINNGALFSGPNGFFNQFPMGAIDRIEVVRGPGAVEYGSDAIGGVINIISRHNDEFSASKHIGGEVYARYGSVNTEKSEWGDLWGSFPRFNFSMGVTGQAIGDYSVPRFGTLPDTSMASEGGYFDTAVRVRTNQVLRLNWIENRRDDVLYYTQSKLNASGIPRSVDPYEERGMGQIAYDITDLGAWSHELHFYSYFQHYRSPRDTTVESATALNLTHAVTSQEVAGGGMQNTTSVWKSALVYGGDYRTEDLFSRKELFTTVKSTDAMRFSIPFGNVPPGNYNVFDAFAIDRFHLSRRLIVTAGGRIESTTLISHPRPEDALTPFTVADLTLNKHWTPLTGSIGAVYAVAGNLSLVGSVASGFRAPTFSDLLSTGVPVFASGIATVPSPAVKPEQTLTYEGGVRWASRKLTATATVYEMQLTNLLVSQASGTINIPGIGSVAAFVNQNSGSGYVRGIESAWAYRLNSHWTLLGNLTVTRGQDTFLNVPLRFIPPANGLAGLYWQSHSQRYWGEANMVMVDRLRRHNPQDQLDAGFSVDPAFGSPSATNPPYRSNYQIPGYAVANLRFGARLWGETRHGVDATLDLNNLLNQPYREPYSQQELLAPGFGAVIGGRWRF
jgi:hemoglobin/transferrin/lactoferrin receptor protein